uniref:Uncharacterized protein n=1 Tax=Arundo donax TaxID=35708 RepID=A0A0A9BAW8_ARUDO
MLMACGNLKNHSNQRTYQGLNDDKRFNNLSTPTDPSPLRDIHQ